MTWIDGLLIFISILLGYFIIVGILHKTGILEKYGISLYGPALLLKTKKGLNFLKKIASKKRFFKGYGNIAVLVCFILMIVMVLFFIWQFNILFEIPAERRAELPGPEFALILPGINPILPLEYLVYIVVALAIAIVVHEFSHGILAYAGDLKVKSMGILYMIIPIGAFVEPDEEQLKETTIPKRLRVFAAGPMSNFVVFLICLLLFSFVFMSVVQPGNGLTIYEVHDDSPAFEEGIRKGAIVTSINDTDITQFKDITQRYIVYSNIINNTKANDTINISYIYNGKTYNKNLELDDKVNYIKKTENVNISNIKGKGETGIFSFVNEKGNLDLLSSLPTSRDHILYLISLPVMGYFNGYNPLAAPFTDAYIITGPLSALPEPVFWGIVNLLYWVFWLNLMVGIFNVLPMVPLDGGFLFNDYIKAFVKKIKKDISKERLDKIVGHISLIVSLFILFMIVFPFFFKYM